MYRSNMLLAHTLVTATQTHLILAAGVEYIVTTVTTMTASVYLLV